MGCQEQLQSSSGLGTDSSKCHSMVWCLFLPPRSVLSKPVVLTPWSWAAFPLPPFACTGGISTANCLGTACSDSGCFGRMGSAGGFVLSSFVFCFYLTVKFTCHLQPVLFENNSLASKEIETFPCSAIHSVTGKPDGFVALVSVSVLSAINVPIASVFWTLGRLWGIESASELPCVWSDLQQRTGMEELIWRWVCVAWKSAAVCLSRKGCGKSLRVHVLAWSVATKTVWNEFCCCCSFFGGRLKLGCFRFIMGKVLVQGLLLWSDDGAGCVLSTWTAWAGLELNQAVTILLYSVLWLLRSLCYKSLTCTFPKPLRWRTGREVKSLLILGSSLGSAAGQPQLPQLPRRGRTWTG